MKLFQLLPEKIVHLTCNWPFTAGGLSLPPTGAGESEGNHPDDVLKWSTPPNYIYARVRPPSHVRVRGRYARTYVRPRAP